MSKSGKEQARERTEKEEVELQKILDVVGLPTYTAYAMYRMNPKPPPAKQAALHAANAVVARNRAELEEARAELSLDPVTRELEEDRAGINDEAAEYLGRVLPEDLGPLLETNVVERKTRYGSRA